MIASFMMEDMRIGPLFLGKKSPNLRRKDQKLKRAKSTMSQ